MLEPMKPKKIDIPAFFSPRSPWHYLGFLIVSSITNLASGGNQIAIISSGVVFILWGTYNWFWEQKRSKNVRVELIKEPPKPAKGLILLLSPYSAFNIKDKDFCNQAIEEILARQVEELQQEHFEAIDILNSNLFPQIKAVEYHFNYSILNEIWLICSESYEIEINGTTKPVTGSEKTALLLTKYLQFVYENSLKIHYDNYRVRDYDYIGLWRLGEEIFAKSGYQNDVVVADITGGTKMMSVALAMACIPPKRRMQYMESARDWQGQPLPKGEMSPVLIDIDSMLY